MVAQIVKCSFEVGAAGSILWLNLESKRSGYDLAVNLNLSKQVNVTRLESGQVELHLQTAAQKSDEMSEVSNDRLELCARATNGVGDG